MPLGFATIGLRGIRAAAASASSYANTTTADILEWKVDFPAGFHHVLVVPLRDFTHQSWDNLLRLEVYADFHQEDVVMDWEFCIDDVELELELEPEPEDSHLAMVG
jgi:hypothetical protein